MLTRIRAAWRADDGAVTVDWVVLAAAVVGLGVVVTVQVGSGLSGTAQTLASTISAVVPQQATTTGTTSTATTTTTAATTTTTTTATNSTSTTTSTGTGTSTGSGSHTDGGHSTGGSAHRN